MNPLYRQAREELLRITLLVGPPRSVSTGIALALAQSPDVDCYVHEPFANDYAGAPSAAAGTALICDIVDRHRQQHAIPDGRRVHIVVKECSTHLRPRHFRFLARHCHAVILMVRSPLLQLSSIARVCKWIWAECPENFRFRVRDLRGSDLRRYERHGDLQTYFVEGWRSIETLAAILDEDPPGGPHEAPASFAIDTEIVRSKPRLFFRRIAAMASLRYSERMICGWRREHLYNIGNDEWARRASRAGRLYSLRRRAPEAEDFPAAWRGLLQEALGAYIGMFKREGFRALFPRDSRVVFPGLAGRALARTAPDTRYAFALTARMPKAASAGMCRAIRREYPEQAMVFDCLDAIARAWRSS